MKIAYDHQTFTLQDYGGISRYFFELLDYFHRTGRAEFELWVRYSNNHYLEGAGFARPKRFWPGSAFRGKVRLIDRLNRPRSRRGLAAQAFDIFHPTYFDPYFLGSIGRKPFVLSVHDMIHEVYPGLFTRRDKTPVWMRAVAGRAARILADSQNTKEDIIRLLGIDGERIDVVHLAGGLERPAGSDAAALSGVPEKYLLFVGGRLDYKNFRPFARAVAPLLLDEPALGVVCAGGGPLRRQERRFLRALGVEDRFLQRDIDDRTLASVYAAARVFVYPSLYEGFGVPILEAFSCACPVALSRASSFPEVAGEAGLYFDPADEASIRETVRRALDDAGLRDSLRAKGREQLKKFSWAKTAEETLAVYEKALPGWV